MFATGLLIVLPAAGVFAADLSQCNGVGTSGAATVTCVVTVTNSVTYDASGNPTDATTVSVSRACTGTPLCSNTAGLVTTSQVTPIYSVTQCDDSGITGAATVTCTVTITNHFTNILFGTAATSSVIQCNSPIGPPATITCTQTPAALPIGLPVVTALTQCNSAGGAGGTITCTATVDAAGAFPIGRTSTEPGAVQSAPTGTCCRWRSTFARDLGS